MPATVKTICNAMEAWAPSCLAYDWDRVGLQIGRPEAPVERVLTCLTVTDQVVSKATQWGANMIVAHHPILFSPLKALRTDDVHTQRCLQLAQHEIACFAAHTNLDVVPDGVNTLLAETLGLEAVVPLVPAPKAALVKLITFVPATHEAALREALARAGAGQIGNYSDCSFSTPGTGTFLPGPGSDPFTGKQGVLSHELELRFEMVVPKSILGQVLTALREAHPYEEPAFDVVALENTDPRIGMGARGQLANPMKLSDFAQHVCQVLKLKHVRMVGRGGDSIQRVALCGGAGGGEISSMPVDIDVYVTGDLKYHEADMARDRGLALIDAGHVGTERGIATHIARYLKRTVPGIEVKPIVESEIFQVVTA
tara:strand:- start:212 stop:1318 length:1107 start_codon:yes stop_codon:yes gene_type:complete